MYQSIHVRNRAILTSIPFYAIDRFFYVRICQSTYTYLWAVAMHRSPLMQSISILESIMYPFINLRTYPWLQIDPLFCNRSIASCVNELINKSCSPCTCLCAVDILSHLLLGRAPLKAPHPGPCAY